MLQHSRDMKLKRHHKCHNNLKEKSGCGVSVQCKISQKNAYKYVHINNEVYILSNEVYIHKHMTHEVKSSY